MWGGGEGGGEEGEGGGKKEGEGRKKRDHSNGKQKRQPIDTCTCA